MDAKVSKWKFEERQDICIVHKFSPKMSIIYKGKHRNFTLENPAYNTLTK